jgi:hypothetical protein
MAEYYLKNPRYSPRLKCDGCNVRDGHEHRCHGIVKVKDFMIRIIHLNGHEKMPDHGKDGIIYEGLAGDLSTNLLETVCFCEICNSRFTNQARAVK